MEYEVTFARGCGHRGCDHSHLIKFSEMQEGVSEEEAACAKMQGLARAFIGFIASLSVQQLLMGRAVGQRPHLPLVSTLIATLSPAHTQLFPDLESRSWRKSD